MFAATSRNDIDAIFSRGGRPDLAGESLPRVQAPTLFIVAGNDSGVIKLNQEASKWVSATKQLTIIPGASHLFEEPGKLEQVASLAQEWFSKYLD